MGMVSLRCSLVWKTSICQMPDGDVIASFNEENNDNYFLMKKSEVHCVHLVYVVCIMYARVVVVSLYLCIASIN